MEPTGSDVMHGFAVARQCATKIATLARARGSATAVVMLPARFQIDEADFIRIKQAFGRRGQTVVRDAATERFHAVLDTAGPPVLDLLPVFRATPNAADLYFNENVHLKARGHQVVAEALAAFLQTRGLLGEPAPKR
jgi:lysophospholipase L1-like esterase